MNLYDDIGVTRVINASGSMTYLGGSLIAAEVLDKMNEAARSFVVMEELMDWAGAEIARLTGTEAGLVTTGSAGGILLAAAACLTGTDRERMRRLPETGDRDEFVVQHTHRIGFDHAIGVAGGRIVEAGGDQGATAEELAAAITERTAGLFHVVLDPKPGLPLAEAAAIARARGVPVVVDAAAEVPPVDNLRAFGGAHRHTDVDASAGAASELTSGQLCGGPRAGGAHRHTDVDASAGAASELTSGQLCGGPRAGGDLVIFSGGKEMAGPNDTGILCGRADLVAAAGAQAFPNPGIGRPLKVSKEQIVGLVFALRRYVGLDHAARMARWRDMAEGMRDLLHGIEGVTADVAFPTRGARPLCIPRTRLVVDEARLGRTVLQIEAELEGGEPAVAVLPEPAAAAIWLNPQHLAEGQEEVVARRVNEVLGRRPRGT